MKNTNYTLIAVFACLGIPFMYAYYLYPSLPAIIPTHFNLKGEADGFGGRDTIYLGPAIMAVAGLFTYFLLANIKKIDPKRSEKIDDSLFKKMGFFTVLFLSVLSMAILYMTTHPSFNMGKLLFPLLGLGFALMGAYLPKLKQNYFAGFKLPWTLENENNWNATHKIAGKVWVYGGVLQLIAGILLPATPSFIVFMALMLVMVLVPTIFSYRMFKNGNQPI